MSKWFPFGFHHNFISVILNCRDLAPVITPRIIHAQIHTCPQAYKLTRENEQTYIHLSSKQFTLPVIVITSRMESEWVLLVKVPVLQKHRSASVCTLLHSFSICCSIPCVRHKDYRGEQNICSPCL